MKCPSLDLLGGEKGESLSSGRCSGAAEVISKAQPTSVTPLSGTSSGEFYLSASAIFFT